MQRGNSSKRTSGDLDIDLIEAHVHKKGKASKSQLRHVEERDERPSDSASGSVVQLLQRCLHGPGSNPDDAALDHGPVAVAIEHELSSLHGGGSSRAYKTAVRNLVANLKRNEELVDRVVSGELSAGQLVHMGPAELATATQQAERLQSNDKLLKKAIIHDSSLVATSEYICPECQSSACSTHESVSVVAGKSDTWGSKGNEGKGRLVTCLTCGHKWEANMM